MSSRQAGAGITHHRHFQPLHAGGAFHAQARAQHGIQNNCGVFGGPGDGAGAVHGIGIGQSTFHRQDAGWHQYTTATCGCGGQAYRSRSIRTNRKTRHARGHRNARPREEPPVKRAWSQGLRAGGLGRSKCSAPVPVPYSQVASLPISGAPVARSMVTMGASACAIRPACRRELAVQGRPATSKSSLMPLGMPESGPVPCADRAPASSRWCTACSLPFRAAMRAKQASNNVSGRAAPFLRQMI